MQTEQRSQELESVLEAMTGLVPQESLSELSSQFSEKKPDKLVDNTKVQGSEVDFLLNSDFNKNGSPEFKKNQEEQKEIDSADGSGDSSLTSEKEDKGGQYIIDNPLFKLKQEAEVAGEENVLPEIKGIEDLNSYLQNVTPEVKDFAGLLNGYKTLKQEVDSLSDLKQKNEQLLNGLRNLHPDLIEAIRLYEEGQDFRSYISSRPSIDYKKDAEQYSKAELVKLYFPSKVSEEDLSASDKDSDDYDPNVERYIDALYEQAKEKYSNEKNAYKAKVDEYLATSEKQRKEYESSIKNSLSSVKEFFPEVPDSYLKSLESKLLSDGIDSLFYDKDGKLKPDAAARFVMASDDGKNLIAQLQEIAKRQAKTEANLDVLTRGKRTLPNTGARNTSQGQSDEKVREYINSLTAGIIEPRRF